MKFSIVFVPMVLSGCALMPDTISPGIEHFSHTTQHAPFTSTPTMYAIENLEVTARWGKPEGWFLELSEGVALNDRWSFGPVSGYGETLGPREQFAGRVGYTFNLHDTR